MLDDPYADVEKAVIAAVDPSVRHVPDEETQRHDGVRPDGTPVEIKTCLDAVKDSGSLRSGRFFINHDAHRWLVENDAVYLFAVRDRDERDVIDHSFTPAENITGILESRVTWAGRERLGPVSLVPWHEVIEP